jgi:hypothetical protein
MTTPQTVEGDHHQTAESLPVEQCPFLKSGAVGDGEPLQEVPSVQFDCFLQLADHLLEVPLGFQKIGEHRHVHPGIAGAVELDCVAGDVEKGGCCLVVANREAKVRQDPAQISPGGLLRPFGPQQAGQLLAAVRAFRFHNQVSQQCPRLVRFEGCDHFSIEGDLDGSKQTDG